MHCKHFPVECFCSSLCRRAAAAQQLPNDVARVVIIYWRDLSLQGGQSDLEYLRHNRFWRRWHVPKRRGRCRHFQRCRGLFPSSNLIIQRAQKTAFTAEKHNRFIDACVNASSAACVCVCVSQPSWLVFNLSLSPFTQMFGDVTWLACWARSLLPSPLIVTVASWVLMMVQSTTLMHTSLMCTHEIYVRTFCSTGNQQKIGELVGTVWLPLTPKNWISLETLLGHEELSAIFCGGSGIYLS